MKNTTKKAWAKPTVSKLVIKNITLGTSKNSTESAPTPPKGRPAS